MLSKEGIYLIYSVYLCTTTSFRTYALVVRILKFVRNVRQLLKRDITYVVTSICIMKSFPSSPTQEQSTLVGGHIDLLSEFCPLTNCERPITSSIISEIPAKYSN
ncbi:hypothetical protein TNIN_443631 [Trichonephila inaurata madagascariensis]|uniref:Uncharacterized protein n=1 Tax=Trichonephila inaurata madagascariensis TaxID=2747483 RepID=A0A8X6K8A7_9ARAC|nr:hypothetical protein TNIN_443631 [Trichonephila inaurata madagascariensis]